MYLVHKVRAGHVARVENRRSADSVLAKKPEARRPLGRPRLRWEDNIKLGLQKVGSGMDWIDLAQDRTGCGLL